MKTILKQSVLPVAVALSLSACAVGPDYQGAMVSVSDTYVFSDTKGTVPKAGQFWWESLGDATLNTMAEDLNGQNIQLKVAAQRIEMANAYQTMVESFKVPSINVGGGYYSYQLSKNDSALAPVLNPLGDSVPALEGTAAGGVTVMDNQHDGFALGGNISWELDLFGRLDRQSSAAQIRTEQAEIYQQALSVLLTADLVHNYLQYRGAQTRKALALENIEDQKKTLRLVESVVNSGYGSELDLAQARAMLSATESVIPQLEIAEQAHKHRLAVLLGEPLTEVDVRLASTQPLPKVTGVIPVGLPSDLLTRRPDIRIAEREMAAVNEELAASVANKYPKFFLTGTPGWSASSFDDVFKGDSFGWVGSAGVSWNVFDGGRSQALVEMQEARFNAAALNYEHFVNSAIAEVDSALFAYGRSQQNRDQIDETLAATGIALNKAKSLYAAGLIDYVAVLDAQRQHRVIQDAQVVATLQTAHATVAVYKSLGGGWTL